MSLNLDPVLSTTVGSLLWLVLIVVALIMSICKNKYSITEKNIARVWQLVEIFGGILFGFIFGGSVT